jgi:PhzF family phenazine biosynthesis protein
MISDISKKYEATGYHVFTLETKDDHHAHCRNFAPLFGIDEEAATGTASGALSGYLFKHQLLNFSEGINYLSFEQGYEMNRPSHIFAQISQDKKEISKVIIGGKGIVTKTEEL